MGGARVSTICAALMESLDALTLNKPEIFIGNCAQRLDQETGQIADPRSPPYRRAWR